ncbi:hypothetical protein SNEBB_004363 [Seison nebaliae]|nr:hypothetical protein SNEBB_004363 [Seison nebaliae]
MFRLVSFVCFLMLVSVAFSAVATPPPDDGEPSEIAVEDVVDATIPPQIAMMMGSGRGWFTDWLKQLQQNWMKSLCASSCKCPELP